MYKAGVVDENKSVVGLAPDSTNRLNWNYDLKNKSKTCVIDMDVINYVINVIKCN
jgi:hypothetical protein